MTEKKWVGIFVLFTIALMVVCLFVAATTPPNVMSGTITDKWMRGNHCILEIDNSFTKAVDDFTYHNAVVGGAYSWKEPQQSTSLAIYTMMPIAMVSVCLIAIVAGDD